MDAPRDIMYVVAEGLLAEGMLEEEDWDQERGLTGSVMRGLRRWTLEHMPQDCEQERPWRMLPSFEIGIGDQCAGWRVGVRDDIGGFALIHNDEEAICNTVVVGAQVESLEGWEAGVGESILATLYHGLNYTVEVASPPWALAVVSDWHDSRDMNDVDPETNEPYVNENEMNPAEFRKQFPTIALKPRWQVKAMKEAEARAKWMRPEDWRGQAVTAAWELRRTLDQWWRDWKRGKCRGDDARYYYEQHIQPVIIQWDERDEVTRVYDDVGEIAYQSGISPCAWLAQFPSGDVEGVRIAARSLRYCLKVVTLCDTLLALLDKPVETRIEAMRERIALISESAQTPGELRERLGG